MKNHQNTMPDPSQHASFYDDAEDRYAAREYHAPPRRVVSANCFYEWHDRCRACGCVCHMAPA